VADAKDGYLFPPHMAGPGQTVGDVLVNGVLKAIETGNFLPLEIQVSQQDVARSIGTATGIHSKGIEINPGSGAGQRTSV
jgi:hypothetical protein